MSLQLTKRPNEPSAKAWIFRSLLGPAMLLDGIAATITVGSYHPGVSLLIARRLSAERFAHCERRLSP